MQDTPARYGTVTKLFHWTTAALILTLIPLGLLASYWSSATDSALATKAFLFSLHKTLGVTVFFVALGRILWALGHTKPGPLHPERREETLLAEITHWTLYISLVAVPLSGWIDHAAATGFAPIWWPFGQSLPFVPKDPAVSAAFGGIHVVLTKVLAVAVALHVAGALKHHFIDEDMTLRRMWFGRVDAPSVPAHRTPIAAPLIAVAFIALGTGAGAVFLGNEDPETPTASLQAVASDWTVEEGTLGITVIQMGSEVEGRFADWTASIAFDPQAEGEAGSVEVTVAIGSLTLGSVTDQAMGPDYFDTERFDTATFSAPITTRTDGTYLADGTLTLKGQEAPVSLPFTLTLDGTTATVHGETTLNRTTWDIGQSMSDESNLGFDVAVTVDLVATRAE